MRCRRRGRKGGGGSIFGPRFGGLVPRFSLGPSILTRPVVASTTELFPAARVRTQEAEARWRETVGAEHLARAALAEARRAEVVEALRQPVPLGPALVAGARIGAVVALIVVGLGEAFSGR